MNAYTPYIVPETYRHSHNKIKLALLFFYYICTDKLHNIVWVDSA